MQSRPLVFAACCALGFSAHGPLRAAEIPGAGVLADLITKQFDANGDSKFDAGEWQAGVAASFAEIDADGDGLMTPAEIDSLENVIGKETGETAAVLAVKLIKPLLLSMDADRDGSVSRDEYTKVASALFAKLDANQDAELTRAELLMLPVKMLIPAGK